MCGHPISFPQSNQLSLISFTCNFHLFSVFVQEVLFREEGLSRNLATQHAISHPWCHEATAVTLIVINCGGIRVNTRLAPRKNAGTSAAHSLRPTPQSFAGYVLGGGCRSTVRAVSMRHGCDKAPGIPGATVGSCHDSPKSIP